jgi:hypothetical protein
VHKVVLRTVEDGELAKPGRRRDTTWKTSYKCKSVPTAPEHVIILDDLQAGRAPGPVPLGEDPASEGLLDDAVARHDRQGRGLSRSMCSIVGSWGPG